MPCRPRAVHHPPHPPRARREASRTSSSPARYNPPGRPTEASGRAGRESLHARHARQRHRHHPRLDRRRGRPGSANRGPTFIAAGGQHRQKRHRPHKMAYRCRVASRAVCRHERRRQNHCPAYHQIRNRHDCSPSFLACSIIREIRSRSLFARFADDRSSSAAVSSTLPRRTWTPCGSADCAQESRPPPARTRSAALLPRGAHALLFQHPQSARTAEQVGASGIASWISAPVARPRWYRMSMICRSGGSNYSVRLFSWFECCKGSSMLQK